MGRSRPSTELALLVSEGDLGEMMFKARLGEVARGCAISIVEEMLVSFKVRWELKASCSSPFRMKIEQAIAKRYLPKMISWNHFEK